MKEKRERNKEEVVDKGKDKIGKTSEKRGGHYYSWWLRENAKYNVKK